MVEEEEDDVNGDGGEKMNHPPFENRIGEPLGRLLNLIVLATNAVDHPCTIIKVVALNVYRHFDHPSDTVQPPSIASTCPVTKREPSERK